MTYLGKLGMTGKVTWDDRNCCNEQLFEISPYAHKKLFCGDSITLGITENAQNEIVHTIINPVCVILSETQ